MRRRMLGRRRERCKLRECRWVVRVRELGASLDLEIGRLLVVEATKKEGWRSCEEILLRPCLMII